jgi:hypothetical protein
MNNEEKLHKALSEMSEAFTTDEFNKKCSLTYGLNELVLNGGTRGYLLIHCKEITRRRWVKRDVVNSEQLELPIEEKAKTLGADPLTRDKFNEMLKTIEEMTKFMERMNQEPTKPEAYQRWKPENYDQYWCVDYDEMNGITWLRWTDEYDDDLRYKLGNCFKTREEAELHRDKQLLTQELKDFAEGGEWDEFGINYVLDHDANSRRMGVSENYSKMINQIYFKTEERAKEAIEHFGDRLKILFN